MNKRFFEKSVNIEGLPPKEIDEFLRKEKLTGRVQAGRVGDFYNMLSRVMNGEQTEYTPDTDYGYFDCKTDEDIAKIDKMKDIEEGYLNNINKDILSQSRLLKAATALAYQFEKMLLGSSEMREKDLNEYLRNLLDYCEDEFGDETAVFGDLVDIDFLFLRYIALLSKKKAFLKKTGKLVRNDTGNISKYTPMEHFGEIYNMDLIQTVMPNFRVKMAQMDIYVRTKFERIERGQNLIIMVDDSGSMNADDKKAMLKAAITLKIRDISPAHNLYIGTFETRLFGFKKIEKGTTFEELNSFIHLNKGGTDVNGCIMNLIGQIKARKLQKIDGSGDYPLSEDSFEILVVNDGDNFA